MPKGAERGAHVGKRWSNVPSEITSRGGQPGTICDILQSCNDVFVVCRKPLDPGSKAACDSHSKWTGQMTWS